MCRTFTYTFEPSKSRLIEGGSVGRLITTKQKTPVDTSYKKHMVVFLYKHFANVGKLTPLQSY